MPDPPQTHVCEKPLRPGFEHLYPQYCLWQAYQGELTWQVHVAMSGTLLTLPTDGLAIRLHAEFTCSDHGGVLFSRLCARSRLGTEGQISGCRDPDMCQEGMTHHGHLAVQAVQGMVYEALLVLPG